MSPLVSLAQQIEGAATEGDQTPTLVVPDFLRLRERFFIELASAIRDVRLRRLDQPLRRVRVDSPMHRSGVFDWLAGLGANRRVRGFNRGAARLAPDGLVVEFELTSILGRQDTIHEALVLGYARSSCPLPSWAAPIFLGAIPEVAA